MIEAIILKNTSVFNLIRFCLTFMSAFMRDINLSFLFGLVLGFFFNCLSLVLVSGQCWFYKNRLGSVLSSSIFGIVYIELVSCHHYISIEFYSVTILGLGNYIERFFKNVLAAIGFFRLSIFSLMSFGSLLSTVIHST